MPTSRRTSRRRFLAAGAVAAALPALPVSRRAFANDSPNERLVIGCIGCGGMGYGDAIDHSRFGDVTMFCDVFTPHAERFKQDPRIGKGKGETCVDYRKVLDNKDIDVVSIVTPDHWHVKIAIEALQAGKQVFCQKPLSLTLEENRLARAAAEKFPKQQFFIGTQQRSDRDRFLRAVNMVHKGLLGPIKKVTVGINGGSVGGPFAVKPVPEGFDWERWLGQAPMVEYRPERTHGNFRWWYEYSGGKFTDWGAHHVDIAQWALGEDKLGKGPVTIDGTDAKHPVPFKDGMPTRDDSFNTAHDFAVKCTYPSGVEMVIDSRSRNGVLFEGEKGKMFVNRETISGKPIEEQWDKDCYGDAEVVALYKGKPYEGHKDNFYRCIREGGLPVSDVFSHVVAMNTCHLAAIAARLGRTITWDPAAEKITGDELAASLAARTPRPGYEIKV